MRACSIYIWNRRVVNILPLLCRVKHIFRNTAVISQIAPSLSFYYALLHFLIMIFYRVCNKVCTGIKWWENFWIIYITDNFLHLKIKSNSHWADMNVKGAIHVSFQRWAWHFCLNSMILRKMQKSWPLTWWQRANTISFRLSDILVSKSVFEQRQ